MFMCHLSQVSVLDILHFVRLGVSLGGNVVNKEFLYYRIISFEILN